MQTWKAKYDEMVDNWRKCYEHSQRQQRWIADCLESRAKFLFRCEGRYSDEYSMVYRTSDGAILQITGGECHSFYSIAEAIALYASLSDQRHNVAMREKLAAVASDGARGPVGSPHGVLVVSRG